MTSPPAVAAYDAHDRISVATDIADARHQLIDRWWSVHAEATTAILAVTRSDVAALNDLARDNGGARPVSWGRRSAWPRARPSPSGTASCSRRTPVLAWPPRIRVAPASTVAIRNGTFATVVAVPGDGAGSPSTREGDIRSEPG